MSARWMRTLRAEGTDSGLASGLKTVRAMQEAVAAEYLGGADQWKTVEKLEQRHKRKP
jgi:hypothetical protein